MVVQGWGVVWGIHRACDVVAWITYKWHRTCRIVVHQYRGWARSICGGLIPVFCFDQNVRQECDHDCTGEHVCGGYQQIIHKFCCREGVDHWPSAKMCFVAIGSLGRAERMSWCRVSRSTTVAAWREGKRRTVAHMEAASCSWVKMDLKLWGLTVA